MLSNRGVARVECDIVEIKKKQWTFLLNHAYLQDHKALNDHSDLYMGWSV